MLTSKKNTAIKITSAVESHIAFFFFFFFALPELKIKVCNTIVWN